MMNFHHHLDLLFRWDRGLSLRNAIYDAVKSNSHVLDAGCGSGLLSLWAAQAGASHVVGVDTCEQGLAQALAIENNLGAKITFIQSDLLDNKLAETIDKFDVALAMLYYNDPRRDERQSQITFEVHRRFLTNSGARIPDRVEYTGYACEWPAQDITSHYLDLRKNIKALEEHYGLSFNALYNKAIWQPHPKWFPQRLTSGRLKRESTRILSEETAFTTVDYTKNFNNGYPKSMAFRITSPGAFTTVMWVQKLYYKDHLIFLNESVSWIGNPIRVNKKEQIKILIDNHWRKSNILTVE